MALVAWSRNMGNSRSRIKEKKHQLELLIAQNEAANLESIQQVNDEINTQQYQEELFWRLCSRSIWLLASDKSTKLFHQRASQRLQKNNIKGFMDDDGKWQMVDGVLQMMIRKGWLKLIFNSFSQQQQTPTKWIMS